MPSPQTRAPVGAATHRHRSRRAARDCCPACAASAGADRRRPATWVSLLCAAVALTATGALIGGSDEAARAFAAPDGSAVKVGEAATSIALVGQVGRRGEGRRALAEEPVGTPAVEWRQSRAVGSPNNGRLENGVLLPALGTGFYTYDPASQQTPGGFERQWGTDMLVRQVLTLGEWWGARYPNQPRLGIGDLSRTEGGPFHGPGVGHASHQNGLDVDIRLPRRDGVEGPATPANYDRELTQALVDRLVAQGADLVLIGPNLNLVGPTGVVVRWPNHDDHLHVRFPNPG